MNWINISGLVIVILMLIPNAIYAYKNKNIENKCTNRVMNIVEQLGRFGSMLLMVFDIGIAEKGFHSLNAFFIWLISIAMLLILYWFFWVVYFKEPKIYSAMLLAIIPSTIFILSGLTLRHWLLVIFGIIFSVGHIYVTFQNNHVK